MNRALRKLSPLLLCSAPGLVVALAAGIGMALWGAAFVNSAWGLGLITLALLACPLTMLLTMVINRRRGAAGSATTLASCCLPGQTAHSAPTASAPDRLVALRDQRQALERELAELRRT